MIGFDLIGLINLHGYLKIVQRVRLLAVLSEQFLLLVCRVPCIACGGRWADSIDSTWQELLTIAYHCFINFRQRSLFLFQKNGFVE